MTRPAVREVLLYDVFQAIGVPTQKCRFSYPQQSRTEPNAPHADADLTVVQKWRTQQETRGMFLKVLNLTCGSIFISSC